MVNNNSQKQCEILKRVKGLAHSGEGLLYRGSCGKEPAKINIAIHYLRCSANRKITAVVGNGEIDDQTRKKNSRKLKRHTKIAPTHSCHIGEIGKNVFHQQANLAFEA